MSDELPAAGGLSPGFAGGMAAGWRVGGYRLEEQIGRGGMAVVFRALDERLSRRVALKILGPELAADAAFRQRFIRESRAAAAVDDPNILPVFEAGEADGVLFIAMRLVQGGDVRSLIAAQGLLPVPRAGWIVSAVASALDAAHEQGLVHRDVKPANMLLDARPGRPDHVYLSDFGLSKAWLGSTGLTGSGLFLGTVDYAAPEQIEGREVDGRTDQYALGCAAFELLAGAPPFRRDQGLAVMYAQLSAPPPALTQRRTGLAPAVDQVFGRVLAKPPADRYASCGEFAGALRSALGLPAYDAGSQDTPPPGQLTTVIAPRSPDRPGSRSGGVAGDARSDTDRAAAQGADGLPRGEPTSTGPRPELAAEQAHPPAGQAAGPAGEQAQREAVRDNAETVSQTGEDLPRAAVQEPLREPGVETPQGPGHRPVFSRLLAAGFGILLIALCIDAVIILLRTLAPGPRWAVVAANALGIAVTLGGARKNAILAGILLWNLALGIVYWLSIIVPSYSSSSTESVVLVTECVIGAVVNAALCISMLVLRAKGRDVDPFLAIFAGLFSVAYILAAIAWAALAAPSSPVWNAVASVIIVAVLVGLLALLRALRRSTTGS